MMISTHIKVLRFKVYKLSGVRLPTYAIKRSKS